ncbi:UDP-glucose dehydrogenase [Desulfocucumis palustris]|uniref:UDP-glucose 6-dehydrogenase n=1 Tax=Desulfocucumis palustris TaxID=1898651 RepID=A0A2L2XDB2_9FIRM|nr:UDP-glucose/GDP-mannose dehydrogenase family protein [Desulfocucumis palustris]GBF34215.1 UDP-glucose dehydrogenase [Desulfocucumis palustris]
MLVSVIGAGYVGLVAACCLANSGHRVKCVEHDRSKCEMLAGGLLPFYEEGLGDLLARGVKGGKLSFSTEIESIKNTEIIIVAVGTPSRPDGKVDLGQIFGVMTDISELATEPVTLIMKSTVPPGLGLQLQKRFLFQKSGKIAYVSNPEFLREGRAVKDWYQPERIVVGAETPEAVETVKSLYSDIEAPFCVMDISSAEMVKYASNAFLATKISFINEIANLCELVGADIIPVARAVGMDGRIGGSFLQAGLGYGGSCFPKDTKGLDFISTLNGHTFNLLKAVIEVNARQRILAVRKLSRLLDSLCGKKIAILGLSFKPGTDDTRESPSLDIIRMLGDEGAEVTAYDPMAVLRQNAGPLPEFTLCGDPLAALTSSHAAVITTEWREFLDMDWEKAWKIMSPPRVILDGRNCLDPHKIKSLGFQYAGMGRA